jgi:hypothetical protein
MGVLTGFTRVPPELVARLRRKPALVEVLLGMSDEGPAALGLKKLPATTGIDKSWDDMLAMLDGAGAWKAHRALSKARELKTDNGVWVRTYTVAQVRTGAAAFAAVDVKAAKQKCLDDKVHGYWEEFDARTLDYVISHFNGLRKFWAEAAKAEQAIVAESA